MNKKENLIWLDIEMTGLDPLRDKILEIAILPTDKDLNILDTGFCIYMQVDKKYLDNMNDWNKETHLKSGLIEKVEKNGISIEKAQEKILSYLNNFSQIGSSPICGNSVHQDRFFLYTKLKKVHDFFHYRNIDVSTIKELSKIWNTKLFSGFVKKNKHSALDDVIESIEELRYYRSNWMK